MLVCGYCGKETSENYNYCEHCYKQIRCINLDCGNMIKPDSPICLVCGSKVGNKEIIQSDQNVYEERIKQTADSFESYRKLLVTDEAVGNFVPFVADHIQSRVIQQKSITGGNGHTMDPLLSLPFEEANNTENDEDSSAPSPIDPSSVDNRAESGTMPISDIFEADGDDNLVCKSYDFKGQSKKEQQIRLIVLYTLAHYELLGKPVPNNENYYAIAKAVSAYDTNFANYLSKVKGYCYDVKEGKRLSPAGTKKADDIIAEMSDKTIVGFQYWEQSSKPARKHSRINQDDQKKVKEWAKDNVDEGKIDIKKLSSATHCAIYALWAIIKHLKKAKCVKPKEAYLFMKEKYETISVKPMGFTKAFSQRSNDKYFKRTDSGLYFLTPKAEDLVEEWRSGKTIGKD